MNLGSGLFQAGAMILSVVISLGLAAWWGPKIRDMEYDRKTGQYINKKTGQPMKKK